MPCCWTVAHQAPLSMGFPRQEYGVGAISLCTDTHLEDIFSWFIVLMQEGGTPSTAWEQALVWHLEMNCLRRCILSKLEVFWKGLPGWRAGGWGKLRELLCHVAHSLRFYGHWVSFWFVSGQSFWIGVLPGGICITPSKVDSGKENPGRLVRPMDWSLLSPLTFPEFFWLVVAC